MSLYTPNGADGLPGTADDNLPIATTTTGASLDGFYLFGFLLANTPYTIRLDNPADFATGGPLAGYTLTGQDLGGDDAADSDAALVGGIPTISAITGVAGSQIQTYDFGFNNSASLGDYVWLDANNDGIQDAAESGINGVTVRLYDSTGATLIATTTTTTTAGIAGYYHFANLDANTSYQIKLDNPADFLFGGPLFNTQLSPANATGDAADSDAALVGGVPTIAVATTGVAGSDTPTYDIGFYRPSASLGDYVWNDVNKNGVQDAAEVGINGVTVRLYTANGADGIAGNADDALPVATTTTTTQGGIAGYYHFANLVPNTTYTVALDNPADYAAGGPLANFLLSPADQGGNDASDSDATMVGGYPTIAVAPTGADQSDTPTYDIGFYQPLSLGNLVWDDLDNDGLKDAGESGIDTVKVNLYLDTDGSGTLNAGDTLIDSQNTSNGGHYLFTDLAPGIYLVQLDPANFTAGGPLVGRQSSSGTNGALSGPYEPGASGVIDNDDNGTTDAGGIVSGPIILALGVQPTAETDTTLPTGITDTALDANSNLTIDFGVWQPASLGDYVWIDSNKDGVQGAAEVGVNGVRVSLYTANGADGIAGNADDTQPVTTTTTFTNGSMQGYYHFANLNPNTTYTVALDNSADFTGTGPLSGYLLTSQDLGGDDATDSDAALVAGVPTISATTGGPGSDTPTYDFGFYQPLSLGNLVWNDLNNNGLKDTSESGIDGVIVNLYIDSDGSGTLNASDTLVATQTTSNGGHYLFTNLAPATYLVQLDPSNFQPLGTLEGYVSSTGAPGSGTGPYEPVAAVGTADNDDNGSVDPAWWNITSVGSVSGPIVLSVGTQPTTETDLGTPTGVTDPASNTNSNLTIDFGVFLPARLGGALWDDTNHSGVWDFGIEPGINYVTVSLYTPNGADGIAGTADDNLPIATTQTAPSYDGHYLFGFLPPNTPYTIKLDNPADFAPGGLLEGYTLTTQDVGSDEYADNDAALVGGVPTITNATTGGPGSQTQIYTFGVSTSASLGDYVWLDANNDGVQDASESGINGVTVHLYDSTGTTLIMTTTTAMNGGVDGYYHFANLDLNTAYLIKLDNAADFTGSGPLANTQLSPANAGTDDAKDSDATLVSGFPTISATTGGPGSDTPTYDAGFYRPSASLGDYVWNDANKNGVQDASEVGINGVTVHLYDSTGTTLILTTTTTTNGSTLGYYHFAGLVPNITYTVKLDNPADYAAGGPLANFTLTAADQGGNDATDSDAAPVGGFPTIAVAPTGADQSDTPTYDIGFYQPLSLGNLVWNDLNNNGLKDASESGIDGVTINLYLDTDGSGTLNASDTLVSSQPTSNGGHYLFTDLGQAIYLVQLDPANFAVGGALAGYTSSTGAQSGASGPYEPGATTIADNDDNGTASGGGIVSGPIALAAGTQPTSEPDTTLPTGITDTALDANGNLTIDFGVFQPVSVGDFVWLDSNANGVQDAGESGLAGVTATLYDATGTTLITTDVSGAAIVPIITPASGAYTFGNLPPGQYTVKFSTIPAGYLPTVTGQGTSATDSNGLSAQSSVLTSGQSDPTLDSGFFQPVSVGDFVWIDSNANGVQDAGELGLAGVTVTLYDATGTTPITTDASGAAIVPIVTPASGAYTFDNLLPGQYTIQFSTIPAGYQPTMTGQGTSATDSNGLSAQSSVLSSGQSDPTLDSGFFQPVSVGDFVWIDANANGVQDAGESGLAGVTVTLYDATGTTPITTNASGGAISPIVTPLSGAYTFANLLPGQYTVKFSTIPAGYQPTVTGQGTSATDSNGLSAQSVVLSSGQSDPTLDSGFFQPVSVGDFVWIDANANGVQDAGELGLMGVTVTLYDATGTTPITTDASGAAISPMVTPLSGAYIFNNLLPGQYTVKFSTIPAGYQPTVTGQGTSATDSNGLSAQSAILASGQSDLTLDSGFFQSVSVGDFVWLDSNANGVQDTGEGGLAGVTATLYQNDGITLITTDALGAPISPMVTDATGVYTFSNLLPGQYIVQFSTIPAGYLPTVIGQGTSATDSNGLSAQSVVLAGGQSDPTLDSGFFQPVSVGDFVWIDANANGVQDAGESGLAGVTVTLYDATGTTPITTDASGAAISPMVTPSSGAYTFGNLLPGQYTVTFSTIPAGYQPTVTGQGTSATDSNGLSAQSVVLTSGQSDPTLDSGFFQTVSVGDFVWIDANANGVQDGGELGLLGVTVTLYDATGTTPITTDALGAPIMPIVTPSSGAYTFGNLPPGQYTVQFSTIPAGYQSTVTGQGTSATDSNGLSAQSSVLTSGQSDPTLDSGFFQPVSVGDFVWIDANANGVQDGGELGLAGVTVTLYDAAGTTMITTDASGALISPIVTPSSGAYTFGNLLPGQYTVQFSSLPAGYLPTVTGQGTGATDSNGLSAQSSVLTSGQSDPTLDSGFFQPVSVGDFVWLDSNANGVQDGGELGLAGVTVTLYDATGTTPITTDASGVPIAPIVTPLSGAYTFGNLLPGQYTVQFSTIPASYQPTVTGRGTSASDSNGLSAQSVVLTSGQSDLTLDSGFYQPVSVGDFVWGDSNANGVQDAGEAGLAGVTVTLYDATGTTPITTDALGAAITPIVTPSSGAYTFGNLLPGQYTVKFSTIPAGYQPTVTGQGTSATDSNGLSAQSVVLSAGQSDLTLDSGFYQPVSVGDFVWVDSNANGVQDAGELGLAGVTATLYQSDGITLVTTDALGAPISPIVTPSSGAYTFSNLVPGQYIVQFSTIPAGYLPTVTGQGTSATDSNGLSAQSVVLASGQSDPTLDSGFFQPVSVGDFVWVDVNANGVQDGGELGLAGVTVTLYDATGTTPITTDAGGAPISPIVTPSSGAYTFGNLLPGQYTVQFSTIPAGYLPTQTGRGTSATDSNGLSAQSSVLMSGQSDPTLDSGFFQPVSVGDFVWIDSDANGIQDAGELGLAGVTVTLYDATGTTPITTDASGAAISPIVTPASGAYTFGNLLPGQYTVKFSTIPAGYQPTVTGRGTSATDSNGLSAQSSVLTSGQSDLTLDSGFYQPVSVGDFVWIDSDANGIQDAGELGLAGVTVTLYDATGTTPITTDALGVAISPIVTPASGAYTFGNLLPGQYTVKFSTIPAGYLPSPANQGADDTADSDGLSAQSSVLSAGQSDLTLDSGFFQPLSLGNRVWNDANNNGIIDTGEGGIGGVTVRLLDSTGTTTLLTTTTDINGYYLFSGLIANSYIVEIVRPAGYLSSTGMPGSAIGPHEPAPDPDDDIDNGDDGTSGGATIRSLPVDLAPGSESTGEENGGGDTTLDANSNLTVDFGLFRPFSLGNRVWDDTNNNGSIDVGETGIGGVSVSLLDSAGTTVLSTTTTDVGGYYRFDLLPAGDYRVRVDAANFGAGGPLAGFGGSTNGQEADPNSDGDNNTNGINLAAPATNGITSGIVTLGADAAPVEPAGETDLSTSGQGAADNRANMTVDFGFFISYSLGNQVWNDANNNGARDAGEAGIDGVLVELWASDAAGVPIGATPVLTQTSSAGGAYLFTGVLAGNYVVVFPASNFATTASLAGFHSSGVTQGGETAASSDTTAAGTNLDHGTTLTVAAGVVPAGSVIGNRYTLGAGQPTGEDGNTTPGHADGTPDNRSNLTADFGFQTLSLGNIIWDDNGAGGGSANNGIKEAGEPGIDGLVVNLYADADENGTPDGAALATTTTSNGGHYLFAGLTAGGYLVELVKSGSYATYVSSSGVNGSASGPFEPGIAESNAVVDDEHDHGTAFSSSVIHSGTITLSAAQEPASEPDGSLPTSIALPGGGTLASNPAGDANTNTTIDFGLYQPLSLGNRVWNDANNNGIIDAGEAGIGNVAVRLLDSTGTTTIQTTATDTNGYYLFSNLSAGSYVVELDPPAGYVSSTGTPGSLTGVYEPASDPDNDIDNGDNGTTSGPTIRSLPIDLAVGGEPAAEENGGGDSNADTSSNLTVDFGLFQPLSLGNRVWVDTNNDGVVDAGESGVAGVTVNLFGGSNTVIASTTTNAQGYYLFTNLIPGSYTVELPAANFAGSGALVGYTSSVGAWSTATGPYEPGATGATDDDDNGSLASGGIRSGAITLAYGGAPTGEPATPGLTDPATDADSDLTIDFGVFQPASLGDRIWLDANHNGVQDAGESGIAGVTVNLYDSTGATLLATTTTNATGIYTFTNLPPNTSYVAQLDHAADYATGGALAGLQLTLPNQGGDDTTDSDTTLPTPANPIGAGNYPRMDALTLAAGVHNPIFDSGFWASLSLGNQVWGDTNNNGVVDTGESGVAGVTVNLLDGSGTIITSTTTNGQGYYLFTGLLPGSYTVELPAANFTGAGPLVGYISSTGLNGAATGPFEPGATGATDGDDNGSLVSGGIRSATVTLAVGGAPTGEPATPGLADPATDANSNLTIDFGVFQPAILGDYVWLDANTDGVQDASEHGVPGVQVQLYQPGTDGLAGTSDDVLVATTTSGAAGDYTFPNLAPGDYFMRFTLPNGYAFSPQDATADTSDSDADVTTGRTAIIMLTPGQHDTIWDAGLYFIASLGDYVWFDQNANGIQDSGEPGVPGVTVTLYTGAGVQAGAPAVTDASGHYTFSNLAPGDYYVVVTPPVGYVISPADQGANDAADSDANPATGAMATTTLTPGENDPTWDAGLYQPVSLGNLVWVDLNNNGVVDSGERGIDGVVINLYYDANGNGQIDAGELVATQSTSGGGRYVFANLVPGSYLVQIAPSNFSGAGVLVGYGSSTGSVGTNVSAVGPFEPAPGPNNDVDNDDNGSTVQQQGIVSAPITLLSGGEPTTDSDTDANSNLTVDFGVFQPAGLGSVVWYDTDRDGMRDPGEAGVPGVTVTLYNSSGMIVATTTTDANGNYQFSNLTPGSYTLGFTTLPIGTTFTMPNQGGDDSHDSDVDPATGLAGPITLHAGENNATLYAGIVTNPTAITLASFTATRAGDQVVVRWVTIAEINTWGFQLYRSADGRRASAVRVTPQLISAQGRGQGGASYSWNDTNVDAGVSYSYWLVETETGGATNEYGPATASVSTAGLTYHVFMPVSVR